MVDTTEQEMTPVKSSSISELVDELIDALRGRDARFNREMGTAIIDLAAKNSAQGVTYRQVEVKEEQGYMTISLQEGFKSAHGGTEQRKPLFGFAVSVGDAESYGKLQARFFGYNPQQNVDNGVSLMDELRETIN